MVLGSLSFCCCTQWSFFRVELSSSVIYSDSSPEERGSALLDRSHCGNNDFIMTRVCAEVKHKDHTNNSLWKVWHHRKDGFWRLLSTEALWKGRVLQEEVGWVDEEMMPSWFPACEFNEGSATEQIPAWEMWSHPDLVGKGASVQRWKSKGISVRLQLYDMKMQAARIGFFCNMF